MHDILQYINAFGYAGLFGVIFFESSFAFMLPGDSLLFTMGALAHTVEHLNIFLVIGTVAIATILGGEFAYHIGDRLEDYRKSKLLAWLLTDDRIRKSETFYKKYGSTTILLARFVPGVRSFASIVAGVASMKRSVFMLYNVLGGMLWATSVPALGYFLGLKYPWMIRVAEGAMVLILVGSCLPFVFHALYKKFNK